MSDPDPLQEAIKRAREIAAKLPPKQTAKRPASDLEDVGDIKVYLAYDKVISSSSSSNNNNSNNNNNNSSSNISSNNNFNDNNNHNHQSYNNRQPQMQDNSGGTSIPLTGANAYPRGGEEKIEIIIPHTVIGLVIGKGGENIKRIQGETGATVRVDPHTVDEQGNKVCTITGTKQAVTEAHSQVLQVIDNAATNKRPRMQVEGGDQFRMKIPASRTGAIIGKGGETIKQIKQQSGCDIELDKNSKDQEESVFIIRGTPDKIAKARALIETRLAHRGRDGNDPSGGRAGGAGAGPGSGGGHHNKYHATGANATPVAQYTDLPTSYAAAPGQPPSADATAAWGAYFAQYSSLFNPATGAPGCAPTNPAAPVAPMAQPAPISAPISAPQAGNQVGQDYTDQWIEYYLAVGRPDYAEQTLQMKKQQQQQQ